MYYLQNWWSVLSPRRFPTIRHIYSPIPLDQIPRMTIMSIAQAFAYSAVLHRNQINQRLAFDFPSKQFLGCRWHHYAISSNSSDSPVRKYVEPQMGVRFTGINWKIVIPRVFVSGLEFGHWQNGLPIFWGVDFFDLKIRGQKMVNVIGSVL